MSYFSKLKKQISQYLSREQTTQIYNAYCLAEKAHSAQKRQSGEPYITHPVAVATILAELRLDPETIMAALMHDVLEDTPVQKSEIIDQFGKPVADLVDGVSKLTKISFANKAEAHAENFRKMVLAMANDLRVILVKLADRLHNMQTLAGVSPEKRRRVAKETLDIYVPLANRLGMHKLRIQLEDLCFIAIYPNRSTTLQNTVKKLRGNRKEVVRVIESAIENTCKKNKLKQLDVLGREKHLYGIYRKMRDRRLSLSEIMDVYAFRIIVDNVEDCYRVLGYVHNLYKPVPERFKDYIAIPKANGYQSLHTTLFGPYGVPIEIQIRTLQMHEMADNGIAAHWIYKSNSPQVNTEAQVRAQAWVKNILEMQKSSASPVEFVENVKIDLFPDEVYVFTPKGDILELPQGATAIDFAYAVHTDVGNSCVAVKIERQYALLSTPLVNGQTINIITAPGSRPNPAWLDFTVTSKARSMIRHYFKKQRASESIELGYQLLEKALNQQSLSIEDIPDNAMRLVLEQSDLKTEEDLFSAIGLGDLTVQLVVLRLQESMLTTEQSDETRVSRAGTQEPISIRGTEGMLVTLGSCCYPIPGDPILGLLKLGSGLIVHAEACSHVSEVKNNPAQYIPLRWEADLTTRFHTKIAVQVENRVGILIELTSVLAKSDCNIEDLYVENIKEIDRRIIILISVRDKLHLQKIMNKIQHVKAVIDVERVSL